MPRNKKASQPIADPLLIAAPLVNDRPLHLLRKAEVCARVKMSNTELYRRIAAGDFPAPVKMGGGSSRWSAWPEHEVEQWIANRITARDARATA